MNARRRRGEFARVGAVVWCRCRLVVVPVGALRVGLRLNMLSAGHLHLPGMGGRRAAMVVGTAERHGRGGSALCGYRQNQQPDQKRPNQQTHASTLPQAAVGV